jgi:signal transduction histidine kinase
MKPSLRVSLLIGFLIAGGILAWQVLEAKSSNREHIKEHQKYGEALLHSFEGVVLRECRRGLYFEDQLQSVFDQTLKRFGLRWVAIRGAQNQVILSSGQEPPSRGKTMFRSPFKPLVPRRTGFGPPMGAGRFGGAKKLPRGALFLEIALPHEELEAKLNQDQQRAILTTIALLAALALLLILFHSRWRSLELQTELLAKEEKMKGLEYLGRLGAGLVHETKNPLAAIRGLAERNLHGNPEEQDLSQSSRMIMEEADRTVARLDEFLLLSRPAEIRKSRFDLEALFLEITSLLEPDLLSKNIDLKLSCTKQQIEGDREQIRRLFMNLLLNAIQNISEGGRIQIQCKKEPRAFKVSILDNGPGIDPEDLPFLFEPYFSARQGGTGLGLSIAQRIALDHGFELGVHNLKPHGANFFLRIPQI